MGTWKTTLDNISQVDLNRQDINRPKTTWDAGPSKAPNQQEPYSPLPVTLDVVTNPDNENWRYPWRFTRRPIGDQSNQGEVTQALEHMLQNLASLQKKAYGVGNFWIDPNGQLYKVPGTHTAWGKRNAEKLNKKFGYDLPLDRTDGHYYVDRLVDYGWVRIADTFGNAQFVIHLKDLNNIPSSVDDFIAANFKADSNIPIWVGNEKMRTVIINDPFPNIQDAVNKELANKQLQNASLEKKAAVEQEYWITPDGELEDVSDGHVRWIKDNLDIISMYGTNTFDADSDQSDYTINKVYREMLNTGWTRVGQSTLASDPTFYIEVGNIGKIPGYIDNFVSQWFDSGKSVLNVGDAGGHLIEITDPFPSLQKAVNKAMQRKRMGKKAYGQSNSVPDYLMDEWKRDQIHDDVDSEPYVNHDQRDYPYGMHDSPENTDSNIGWAKDNEPYVVRLDQIQKPFDRKWAPGLPEYQVFFFDTMPMSDGAEI